MAAFIRVSSLKAGHSLRSTQKCHHQHANANDLISAYRSGTAPLRRARTTAMSAGVSAAQIHANLPLALTLSTLAGLSTGLGALPVVLRREMTAERLGMWQGAAGGFMVAVSVADLIPAALQDLQPHLVLLSAATGATAFILLHTLLPEPDFSRLLPKSADKNTKSVMWSGLLTALGIALHNVPEGFAVAAASLRGVDFGVPLAIAIGLHNLPEGVAVALPVYFATRNRGTAVRFALYSGLAEPAGVLVMLLLLSIYGDITGEFLAGLLASVAGVMTSLSVVELFPQAFKQCGTRDALLYASAGFAAMVALLLAMESVGLAV